MFSVNQKRMISEKVQEILRETNHPELPEGEIQFHLHVDGAESWSWADIKNNGAVTKPDVNPHNERLDPMNSRVSIDDVVKILDERGFEYIRKSPRLLVSCDSNFYWTWVFSLTGEMHYMDDFDNQTFNLEEALMHVEHNHQASKEV